MQRALKKSTNSRDNGDGGRASRLPGEPRVYRDKSAAVAPMSYQSRYVHTGSF